MNDLLDVQVELFPVLLRRLAAGERLASESDDTEKLAASLLVAEAIEDQRTSSEEVAAEQPREEKKAVLAELGIGAALGAAATKIKPLLQKLHGTPEIEGGGELIKSFRDIIRSQQEAQSAKRKLIMAGIGGAAVGALATKALDHKKESAPVVEVKVEEKSADVAVSNIEEKPIEQRTPETKNARAVLDRLLKNFA